LAFFRGEVSGFSHPAVKVLKEGPGWGGLVYQNRDERRECTREKTKKRAERREGSKKTRLW